MNSLNPRANRSTRRADSRPERRCPTCAFMSRSSAQVGHLRSAARLRKASLFGSLIFPLLLIALCFTARAATPPNIVLILADDLGYADVGCFGAKDIRTPHLDRLAKQGTRFTSFYVAQPVCTASRAALMSGCYPNRIGMAGALNHTSRNGIHPDEWLLPKMLKARGYATACVGKWHLGTVPSLRATRNGFDEWFGTPYSNDNSKYHPVLAAEMPPFPLHDGDKVVELDPDAFDQGLEPL